DAVLLRLERDLTDGVVLSSQLRWNDVSRTARFTTPTQENPVLAFDAAPTQTLFYGRTNENVTSLTNLAARFDTGGLRHSLALGAELSREKSTAQRFGS